jgi:hypothetical protein
MFEELMQRSESVNEKNDCVVKALSILTDYDYDDVRYVLGLCGRKPKRGCDFRVTSKAIGLLRHKIIDVSDYFSSRTVRTLEREMQGVKGRYLVRVRRHMLAVVDGKVHDWSRGRCHRIREIYQIKETDKEWHMKNIGE